MKNAILRYGFYALITGIILFISALLFGKNLEMDTQAIIGYTSIVLSLLFIFSGIKYFRDTENNGSVSFGKALIIGLVISAIAGIGFGVVDYIYTTVINPDFYEEYTAAMKAKGETEIYEIGSSLMAFVMFATVVVIGFIISLLSALILQRK